MNVKLHRVINTFGVLFERPFCGKIEVGSYWVKFILCQGDKSGWLVMCFFGPWSALANTDQHWEAVNHPSATGRVVISESGKTL